MVSGSVSMVLYPFAAATAASPIPVFPLVGSMIVAPGFSTPFSSASSIIASAIRSFTDPAGFRYSSLASNVVSVIHFFSAYLLIFRIGVPPISSNAIFLMSPIFLPLSFISLKKAVTTLHGNCSHLMLFTVIHKVYEKQTIFIHTALQQHICLFVYL